jgi:hypothetical protein
MQLKVRLGKGRNGTEMGSSVCDVAFSCGWIGSRKNLSVAIAILSEGVVEKTKFYMETVLVIVDFGFVCQGEHHSIYLCKRRVQS